MELVIKKEAQGLGPRFVTALLALVGGFFCAFFGQPGIIFLPLAAAPLASLFMLEDGKKRFLTGAVCVLLPAMDAAFNGFYSFACLGAIIVAAMIYVSLDTGFLTKGDSAIAALILLSVTVFLTVILYGCLKVESFNFNAAMEYYRGLVREMEGEWIALFASYLEGGGNAASASVSIDALKEMYYGYVHSAYSIIMMIVLVLIGLSYKLFISIHAKYVERKSVLYGWRFTLSPIYGYAYLAVWFVGLFATGFDTASVVIMNVSNILCFVLAYIGFLFLDAYFRMRSDGRSGAKLIVVLSFILFGATALTVLSFVGVLASVMINKFNGRGFGDVQNGKEDKR